MTRQFIVNWLNKADVPLGDGGSKALLTTSLPLPEDWPQFAQYLASKFPGKTKEIKGWQTFAQVPQSIRGEEYPTWQNTKSGRITT